MTTPEKWDVVTRKPTGEGELVSVRYNLHSCFLDFQFLSLEVETTDNRRSAFAK